MRPLIHFRCISPSSHHIFPPMSTPLLLKHPTSLSHFHITFVLLFLNILDTGNNDPLSVHVTHVALLQQVDAEEARNGNWGKEQASAFGIHEN